MKPSDCALKHQKPSMRRNTTGELIKMLFYSDTLYDFTFFDQFNQNVNRSIGYMRPLSIWSMQIALRGRKENKEEEEEKTKDSILIWGGETLKPKLNVIKRLIRTNGFKCNFNVFKMKEKTAITIHCDIRRAFIFDILFYLNLKMDFCCRGDIY